MKTAKKIRHLASAFTLCTFATVFASACGSSDDNPNPDIVGDSGIPTTDGSKDTSAASDTTATADTTTGDAPATDSVIADGTDATPWDAASGLCYPGDPTSDVEFLDHCTSATCIPYDNKKLTKLNPDGSLPPLP